MISDLRSFGAWTGIGLAVLVSIAGGYLAVFVGQTVLGFDKSPVSDIMMAIILGMLIANIVRLPDIVQPGLKFCTSAVLRIGIMLLGIRLSLLGAGQFTLVALPFVIAAIAVGLVTVRMIGRRMGLTRQLAGLIAVGTSICGCTAIVAAAPLIRANESEVTYAISCVTIFGIAAMFFYPLVAHQAFATQPELAGLFLGTSIHETAQVAGAGMMYEAQYGAPVALDIATVTKLVRNLCMIAVIPLIAVLFASEHREVETSEINFIAMIPWFIVGFAVMSALRTVGDLGEKPFGVLSPAEWHAVVDFVREVAERCLLIAMAAVGLTSMFSGVIRIGMRPFALGLFAALLIGGVSFALISIFGGSLVAALV